MALDVLTSRSGMGAAMRVLRGLGRHGVRLASLLVAVSILGFTLVELSPVDPVQAYVGAETARIGPDQRAQIEQRFGLDEPPLERFGHWAGQVVRGNLGTSTIHGLPVTEVIAERAVASFALLATAWVLSGLVGFALGLLAAMTRGSPVDRGIRWVAYTLASAPTFWVGLLLLAVFSVSLGWTPVCCAAPIGVDPAQASLWQRVHHLVLPAVTLSLAGIAPITLHTRTQAVEVLRSDYVTFSRALGERGRGLAFHRVLRNAAAPAVMLQFASLSEIFGGAVLAEQVFNYPGLGQATVQAAVRSDVPLLLGIVLFSALFVYVGNAAGDVVHAWVDPRVQTVGHRHPTVGSNGPVTWPPR